MRVCLAPSVVNLSIERAKLKAETIEIYLLMKSKLHTTTGGLIEYGVLDRP